MPQATKVKKLVPVSTSSALVTEASKKAQKVILDQVPYIYYPVQFRKDKGATMLILINLNSKVNAITPGLY